MSFICESIKLSLFENFLRIEEKSKATVEKYLRDVRAFFDYTRNERVDKSVVLSYFTVIGPTILTVNSRARAGLM